MVNSKVSDTKNKYEKNFSAFQFFSSTISSFSAGVIALVFLGEASFSPEYIFTFLGIISATVAFLYATLFDTSEKLNACSTSLKENKIMKIICFLALVSAVITIFIIPFSVVSTILIYLFFVLLSIYFVIVLDLLFSR